MEEEDLRRPFRFIVTGRYIAVHYDGNDFELHSDRHSRGTLFHLSDDDEKIIYNRTYIGHLISHPDYQNDVFYIRCGQQYLSQRGQWTDSVYDALKVQIDPEPDWGGNPPTIPPLANPVISARNPISADGIDLYHPDQWFILYPITGDCLWMGNSEKSLESKLVFRGNPYSDGLSFQLSVHDEKTRISSDDGMFLTVIMSPGSADYLNEECRHHNASSRCPRCMDLYTIGFHSEPRDCITLVPRGLPSMFALYDGIFYYRVDVVKGSYAELDRVERIEDASLFQFVGFL